MPHFHRHAGIGQRPLVEPLEPRLLFSATADISLFDDSISDNELLNKAASETDLINIYNLADITDNADISTLSENSETTKLELVFVDTAVEGYQQLVDDITQQSNGQQNDGSRQIDIILLNQHSDGIQQITDNLNHHVTNTTSVSAVHIISHGSNSSLQLGNATLSESNLQQHSNALQSWQQALTDDADLMIYGCNLASDPQGESLISQLSQLTGADIAASNDITANQANNGDWELEYHHGHIDTALVVSEQAQQNWSGSLATETVLDQFNSGYSGNDGSQNWVGDWQESDDGSGPGNIKVAGNQLMIKTDNSGDFIYRTADLSGATSATLSYDVNNVNISNADLVRVEVSGDGGGSWTTLADYTSSNLGSASASFDISDEIAADTQVRISVITGDRNDTIWFDNIQIQYSDTPPPPPNNLPTATDNTLTINEDIEHTFLTSDFGYNDADSDPMASITITNLESAGDLTLNGSHVAQLQVISKADIEAGLLKFSPGNHEHGSSYDSFQFTVNDGTADSASPNTISFDVNAVNDAPTTTGLANVNVNEDAPNEQLDLFAAFDDIEDDDSDLSFSLLSNTNPGLLNVASIDHGAGTLTLDFAANQFGNSTITVRATDSEGASVDSSFDININAINDAPTTTGIDDIVTEAGASQTQINLASVFSDNEPGPLHYSVESNTNPAIISSATINGSGLLRLEYAPGESGQTSLTVRATDPEGDWIESSFTVDVTALPAADPVVPDPDPITPDPIEPDPVLADPAIPDPIEPEPDPVLADPVLADPAIPDSILTDSVQESHTEPSTTDNNSTLSTSVNERHDDHNSEQGFQSTAEQESEQQQHQSQESTDTESTENNPLSVSPLLASIGSPEQASIETTTENSNAPASQIYTPPALQTISNILSPITDPDALPDFENLQTSDAHVFYVDHNNPEHDIYQELRNQANDTLVFSQLPAPAFGINPAQFNQDLESHFTLARNEMAEAFTAEYANSDAIRGLAITVTSGVMIWALRASSLILALVSTTPAWKGLDPLPVLAASRQKRINEKIKQYQDKLSEDTDNSEVGHLFDYFSKSRKPNE